MRPVTDQAYKLLHDGCVALSQVEAAGMRVDMAYLNHAIKKTEAQIKTFTVELKDDKVYKVWRKVYGEKTNLGSHQQLGKVLFTVMKHPCSSYTKTGRPKTDVGVLEGIDLDFVRKFLTIEKLKKANSTYLKGIRREVVDGFIHPFYNLHTTRTFRSSSDKPNFQNIPIRNPEIAKLIRRCFIPRKNHLIVEIDYSGAEICAGTCYHKDPRMMKYIQTDPGRMHLDMAARCYMLPNKRVSERIRYWGKSGFVFPQFYGDYYIDCAQMMWNAIGREKLETADGVPLKRHLREQGITGLGRCDPKKRPVAGTFEKHIQDVEYDFWHKVFKVYDQWRKDWWESYQETGGFDLLTGFYIEGFYGRNDVINYPIQGTAFHFLLWSLIQLVRRLRKMQSLVVGQIHDSIVGDVHRDEFDDYVMCARQIMTKDIRKHWCWINVPLTVDVEAAPEGKSWWHKEKIKDA